MMNLMMEVLMPIQVYTIANATTLKPTAKPTLKPTLMPKMIQGQAIDS